MHQLSKLKWNLWSNSPLEKNLFVVPGFTIQLVTVFVHASFQLEPYHERASTPPSSVPNSLPIPSPCKLSLIDKIFSSNDDCEHLHFLSMCSLSPHIGEVSIILFGEGGKIYINIDE